MSRSDEMIDLAAYFDRIGFDGDPAPDFATLTTLHALHPAAIPFENFDAFLHQPVAIDLAAVEEKLVRQRRGGWCFEQNRLFMAALEQIGFSVTGFSARVLWNMDADAMTPLSHMILLVGIGRESWIADVGFGALPPTAPLRLVSGMNQQTPRETFRFIEAVPMHLRLEALLGGNWVNLYHFARDQLAFPCDFEVANHYLATHDSSHFRHGIVAARVFDGGRYTLRTGAMTTYDRTGKATREDLTTQGDYLAALERIGVNVPDPQAVLDALAREGIPA